MRRLIFWFLIILPGAILYLPSLKYGFSQDDFIHLYSSKATTIGEFLNFFNPFNHYPDIFFYRPLTTQVYFFINNLLFGLNPLPYHIEGLILHLINSVLFLLITKSIWQNKQIAFISAFFYSISAAHFLSLYYISAFQETGRMFFILLSLLLFFNYLDCKKRSCYILSITAFIGALLSKETSLILPLLFFPLVILKNQDQKILKVVKTLSRQLIPYLLIIILYVGFRLAGFQSIFNEGDYHTTFSISGIIQNLKWYIVWSFGLPEVLSTIPSLRLSSLIQFGKDMPFGNMILILFTIFTTLAGSLIYKLKISTRILLSSISIYIISLLPILILRNHRYPQYLDLAFLGFLPILASLFYQSSKTKKVLGFCAIAVFTLIQLLSLNLSEHTHWTTHRAIVADHYYKQFKNIQLPDNSTIIFAGTKHSSYELSIALAQKYALLVWFPDKIKQVKYKTEAVNADIRLLIFPVAVY